MTQIAGHYAEAPIARHRTWRHLLRWLVERVDRRLADISHKDLTARLVAVATLGRWIAWQDVRPARPGRFRVAIIGAHELDTFDRGKWYGLLPALLGCDAAFEMSFVGPSVALEGSRFPPVGPPSVGAVTGRTYPVTVSECWQDLAADPPDLAMMFQPGLETNDSWFAGPGLSSLVTSGIPVGATSYGRDEYVIDRTVLVARGYSAAGDAVENPFYMEMGHANIRWGHTLWRLGPDVPGPGFVPDKHRLEGVGRLSQMLARLFAAGFVSEPLAFGTDVDVLLPGHGRARLIFLLGDLYADPQTGALLRRRGGDWHALEARLPTELLRTRPAPAPDSLDCALWAAELVDGLL
jgi:hypothetical protein